ncbi:DUF4956 domain-containing protein [Bacteriovoracales bacterium]|nr:DUF4956 domain-containing protein [Bacteriovoracales bacterium]
MKNLENFAKSEMLAHIYGPNEILLNLALAFILGMLISSLYKTTHKGLSYSQSFMLTIIFVSVIVSMVIMTIGNNLARAFALVGALSIIRFRTVIKDTKDTAYIFMGLAVGMAAGTSSYFLAIVGTLFFFVVSLVLHKTNYGAFYKSEFILTFRRTSESQKALHSEVINKYSRNSSLLHVESLGENQATKLTYDITMNKNNDPQDFSQEIASLEGVSEVMLVASNSDLDY